MEGSKLFLSQIQGKKTWPFLMERFDQFNALMSQNGVFRITPGVRKPRFLFIWSNRTGKENDQSLNHLIFDTYKLGNDATVNFSDVYIELNEGIRMPQTRWNPGEEVARSFNRLKQYMIGYN